MYEGLSDSSLLSHELAMIIGTRTLAIETDSHRTSVEIRLYLPEQDSERPEWRCRYEIDWPDGEVVSFAFGNDALHAIHAALQKLGAEVHASSFHKQRKMSWMKPWVGYGFPMPKGARDVLIGDDQKFYGLDDPVGED